MRYIIHTILLCLPLLSTAAQPQRCPDVSEIRLVPGEYAWRTDDIRFEGYFASPQTGRGLSTHVVNFMQARWMQFNNLPNSKGVVECDYVGNYGNEVVRVIQAREHTSAKPLSQYWGCTFNPDLPSTQCICSGTVTQCAF